MKKSLITIAAVLIVAASALTLTACGNIFGGGKKESKVVAITWLQNSEIPYQVQYDKFDASKLKIEVHFEDGTKQVKSVQKDWVKAVFAYTSTGTAAMGSPVIYTKGDSCLAEDGTLIALPVPDPVLYPLYVAPTYWGYEARLTIAYRGQTLTRSIYVSYEYEG